MNLFGGSEVRRMFARDFLTQAGQVSFGSLSQAGARCVVEPDADPAHLLHYVHRVQI